MGNRTPLDYLIRRLQANDPDTDQVYLLDVWGRNARRTVHDETMLLGHALRSNTVVTSIDLDLNSRMTVEGMRGIAEFISDDTTNLSEIHFFLDRRVGDNISPAVKNQLLEAVAENGRIQKLTWPGPFLTRSMVVCLMSLRGTLRSLTFEDFFTPAAFAFNARRDAEILANAVGSLSRLEELKFAGRSNEPFHIPFLANEPFLTPFLNQLGNRDEHPLVLKNLVLEGYEVNSEPVARALGQVLTAARNLERFQFRLFESGGFGIVLDAIGEQHSIRYLDLSGRITEEHTARMAQVLRNKRNISRLNFKSTDSSLLHVCTIVEALIETRHPLQNLVLCLNREQFGLEAFVAGHKRLGELLPLLTSLKSLYIIVGDDPDREDVEDDPDREDVELFYLPAEIEEQLVSGFRGNTSLTSANLSWGTGLRDQHGHYYNPSESVVRAIDFYTMRNRVHPALDGASVAGMLSVFADRSAFGLGESTHFRCPENMLSVVFETLRGRADWFPDF